MWHQWHRTHSSCIYRFRIKRSCGQLVLVYCNPGSPRIRTVVQHLEGCGDTKQQWQHVSLELVEEMVGISPAVQTADLANSRSSRALTPQPSTNAAPGKSGRPNEQHRFRLSSADRSWSLASMTSESGTKWCVSRVKATIARMSDEIQRSVSPYAMRRWVNAHCADAAQLTARLMILYVHVIMGLLHSIVASTRNTRLFSAFPASLLHMSPTTDLSVFTRRRSRRRSTAVQLIEFRS